MLWVKSCQAGRAGPINWGWSGGGEVYIKRRFVIRSKASRREFKVLFGILVLVLLITEACGSEAEVADSGPFPFEGTTTWKCGGPYNIDGVHFEGYPRVWPTAQPTYVSQYQVILRGTSLSQDTFIFFLPSSTRTRAQDAHVCARLSLSISAANLCSLIKGFLSRIHSRLTVLHRTAQFQHSSLWWRRGRVGCSLFAISHDRSASSSTP